MGKTIAKYVAIGLIVLLVLASFGYNALVVWAQYANKLRQEGVNFALTQLTAFIKKDGQFKFDYKDPQGQDQSITFIEKANDAKR